jgi:hypothetical protein
MADQDRQQDDKPGVTSDGQLNFGVPLDDTDLMKYFHESLESSTAFFGKARDEAKLILDMYAGDTLSESDKLFLEQTKRAPVSFNFASATIDTFDGMNPPKDAIFRGQDAGEIEDAKADWLTTIVRQEVERCNGHDADSRALRSMLNTGYGFTETYLDTSRVPIHIRRKYVPFYEVWPDPDACDTNLQDARFIIQEHEWLLEEVQARWPQKAKQLAGDIVGATTRITGSPTQQMTGYPGSSMSSRSRIKIYRFLYCRYMPRAYYLDPQTGDEVDGPYHEYELRHDELQKMPGQQFGPDPFTGQPVVGPKPFPDGIGEVHQYRGIRYYQAYVSTGLAGKQSGSGLVLSSEELSIDRFPIQALTGFTWEHVDDKRIQFFGLGRKIYQPQLFINKTAATYLDILQRGAKGGGFYEEGVPMGSDADFVQAQATPGSWTKVHSGTLQAEAIMPKPMQAVPPGIESFLNFCIGTLNDISLISKAAMGTAEGGDAASNVALANLQEHNQQGLGLLFRANNLYLQEVGTVAAAMVLRHLPAAEIDKMLGDVKPVMGLTVQQGQPDPNDPSTDPQLVPILIDDPSATPADGAQPGQPDPQTGQPGPPQRPIRPSDILKASDPFDYDVTVDTGQASPTQKLAAFSLFVVTDLIGTLVKAGYGSIIIPELMKIAPLPGTMGADLADEIQKQVDAQNQGPDPDQLVKELQSMGPDQIQQMLDKAGIRLPTKQKPPSVSIALKGALPTDPNENAQLLQQVGIQPTPDPAAQLHGAAAAATAAGAEPPPHPQPPAPPPPLDPNQVLQAAAQQQQQPPQPGAMPQ